MDEVGQRLDMAHDIFQRALAEPDAYPDHLIVIPLSLLAEGSLLSPARLETLMRLRRHGGYERLQDLADDLGRGKHRVSKDISALASLGLVHKHRHGRQMHIAAVGRPILLVD